MMQPVRLGRDKHAQRTDNGSKSEKLDRLISFNQEDTEELDDESFERY